MNILELQRQVAADPHDANAAAQLLAVLARTGQQITCAKYIKERDQEGNPQEIEDYDWKEAFGYAGEPNTCVTEVHRDIPTLEKAFPGCPVSEELFDRSKVCHLEFTEEGEHDGPPWIAVGHLLDGRWFKLEAGCDYTGWD